MIPILVSIIADGGISIPEADAIVDKSLEEDEALVISSKDLIFLIGGCKDGGVGRCHGNSHCGSFLLEPVSIAELKNIISHNNCQSSCNKVSIGMMMILLEVFLDGLDPLPEWDVGVHGHCVEREEFDGGWEDR